MKQDHVRICVPVCVHRIDELGEAFSNAAKVADIVELRIDCLDQHQEFLHSFSNSSLRAPLILTNRPTNEGGHHDLSFDARRDFWTSLKDFSADGLIDLELDLVNDFAASGLQENGPFNWNQVICSHHDFNGTPTDLEQVYQQMAATPARIIKLAAHAGDASDCLPIFRLLDRGLKEGRDLIALSMGQPGLMTRILGPSRGSFLTYAFSDPQAATAPGQISVHDLREVYRVDHIDKQTLITGIIGAPVSHSVSPQIHNGAFAAANINAVYIPFEVHDLDRFFKLMVKPDSREIDWNLRGLSVTAPHKSAVMHFLDWVDDSAKQIGAANTIVVEGDQLHGYNTDVIGFLNSLRSRFGSLSGARCAIIGAGGAARAALWALRQEKADCEIFARASRRAAELASQFGLEFTSPVNASYQGFDIVINATPLGTEGEHRHETPATADQLAGVRLAYDLVYNPLETRFLLEARFAECATMNGLEMLINQAAEQFSLWTRTRPELAVMRTAAMKRLS